MLSTVENTYFFGACGANLSFFGDNLRIPVFRGDNLRIVKGRPAPRPRGAATLATPHSTSIYIYRVKKFVHDFKYKSAGGERQNPVRGYILGS